MSLFFVLISALLITNCNDKKTELAVQNEPAATHHEMIKRGAYLVAIMGCHDCHSPKRIGPQGPEIIPEKMLSGYQAGKPLPEVDLSLIEKGWALFNPELTAAIGPWGASFAANITSDETGVGLWTEEQFRKAFTQGKSKGLDGARPLLPPMPWFNYVDIRDEDLKAIFAYLKSTKPVNNVPPNPIPPDEL